jgi:hypothetical protein
MLLAAVLLLTSVRAQDPFNHPFPDEVCSGDRICQDLDMGQVDECAGKSICLMRQQYSGTSPSTVTYCQLVHRNDAVLLSLQGELGL